MKCAKGKGEEKIALGENQRGTWTCQTPVQDKSSFRRLGAKTEGKICFSMPPLFQQLFI